MKKFLFLLLSFVVILSTFCISNAVGIDNDMFPTLFDEEHGIMTISEGNSLISPNPNSAIRVQLDGQYIDFADVEPQIINGRTMVPFRKIFNELGVTDENITYISSEQPITAKKDNIEVILTIGSTSAQKVVDGVTTNITLDSAPVVIDGRTLVPVRFIAESMDKKVGWDSYNRTVIIIDTAKLENEVRNKIPKYMELVELQKEPIETFDISAKLNGSLKYSQKSQKSNASNLDVDGTIKMKKSNDAILMELDAKITGKGVLYEAFRENGLTSLDYKIILANDKMYIKSSLLDETTGGKWAVMDGMNMDDLDLNLNTESNKLFDIDEELMNTSTYESMKEAIDILSVLFADNRLKISGTTTKKYEFSIDLDDIIDIASKYGADVSDIGPINKFDIKSEGTIKNGVADSSKADFSFGYSEDDESISFDISIDAKVNSVNKSYNIDIPSASEIMDVQ